jgi:chaperonin GroEL (HSP60 family)
VQEYPDKVVSLGFDKTAEIHGRLLGIKGQYMILDKGVINIRKHAGYYVKLTV